MKKILLILFMVSCFFACENEDLDPRPDLNDNVGAVTIISNQSTASFDLTEITTSSISFDVDVDGFEITDVTSVDVLMTFTDVGRLPNPDPTGDPLDSVYAAVNLANVTTFPSTVTIQMADIIGAIADFSDPANDFFIGDNFNFTFPINTADGRTLTTALESDLCQQPAQPSFGGCNVSISVVCPFVQGDAIGTYSLVQDGFPASLDPAADIIAIAGPDANSITFVDLFKHPEAYDVTVSVDPVSSTATVAQQPGFNTTNLVGTVVGTDFGEATVEGSGTYFSCIGTVTLTLTTRVAAGSFGSDTYILQRQ